MDVLDLPLLDDENKDALEALLDNPINLNDASPADLWFLHDSLARELLNARGSQPFKDWNDLAARTSLPPSALPTLKQLVYLPPARGIEAHISTRITSSTGDERIRTRLNVGGGSWMAQWVGQRDPGEYHLIDRSDISLLRYSTPLTIALGAHRATWGLGLVMAHEFTSPHGEAILAPDTLLFQLKPGYSNSNTGVIRGVSLLYRARHANLATGISHQTVDITTASDGMPHVVAYRTHTKPGPATHETFPYLAFTVNLRGWNIGGFANWNTLQSTTVSSRASSHNHSFALQRMVKNYLGEWHFAHETAIRSVSSENAESVISRGSQTRLTFRGHRATTGGRIRMTVTHRHFSPNWTTERGQLVGDRLDKGNESGWLIVWQWSRQGWKVGGYLDGYQQLQNKDLNAWPRDGWESGLTLKCRLRVLESTIHFRQRNETTALYSQNSAGLDILQSRPDRTHYARCTAVFTPISRLRFRFIAAMNQPATQDTSRGGETFGASLRYRSSPGIIFTIGAHRFNIADWDHRLYVYEDGLPGEFNFQVLSGSGTRIHTRIALPIGENSVAFRAAQKWWRQSQAQTSLRSSTQMGLQIDIAL